MLFFTNNSGFSVSQIRMEVTARQRGGMMDSPHSKSSMPTGSFLSHNIGRESRAFLEDKPTEKGWEQGTLCVCMDLRGKKKMSPEPRNNNIQSPFCPSENVKLLPWRHPPCSNSGWSWHTQTKVKAPSICSDLNADRCKRGLCAGAAHLPAEKLHCLGSLFHNRGKGNWQPDCLAGTPAVLKSWKAPVTRCQ